MPFLECYEGTNGEDGGNQWEEIVGTMERRYWLLKVDVAVHYEELHRKLITLTAQ